MDPVKFINKRKNKYTKMEDIMYKLIVSDLDETLLNDELY